jgi:hypothetical protein
METRTKLVQDLEDARQAMRAIVSQADPQSIIYDPWHIKEVIDHLTGWDDLVVELLQALAAGQEPPPTTIKGLDYYNQKSVTTRGPLSLQHSINEWERTRQMVIDQLQKMPEDRFDIEMKFPWNETGDIAALIAIFVHHENDHAQEIAAILAGEN